MQRAFFTLGFFILVGYVLVVGKTILLPFLIALLLTYLVIQTQSFIQEHTRGQVPNVLLFPLTLFVWLLAFIAIGSLLAVNIDGVIKAAPIYQERIDLKLTMLEEQFGFERPEGFAAIFANIDIPNLLGSIAGAFSTITGNVSMVMLYMLFLFIELKAVPYKIRALFPDGERRTKVKHVMAQITESTNKYLWTKTWISMLTGLLCFVAMQLFDLDFAAFWAFLIFLLNFIPVIGSIVSPIFPLTIAFIQFETLEPFILLAIILYSIQLTVGNIIEPRFMGRSLNLSGLTIIIALVFWGAIWGIVGMLLSIPITMIIKIVLQQFPGTQGLARLMSEKVEDD